LYFSMYDVVCVNGVIQSITQQGGPPPPPGGGGGGRGGME
jgi:hypothetical protein